MKKNAFLRLLLGPLGFSALLLIALAAFAAAGKWIAWPAYKEIRENRWVASAEEAFAGDDLPTAMGFLRKIIQTNPGSLEAWRMAEKIARAGNSPELPFILTQLIELEEDDMDLRLELAELSIARREFAKALELVRSIGEETVKTPRYHQVAAHLAIAAEKFEVAEYHLMERERLTGDDSSRLALASLRLQHSDLGVRSDAAETLHSLTETSDSEVRFRTLRTLLIRSAIEKDVEGGIKVLEAFRAEPAEHNLADRVLILQAVLEFTPEKFEDELSELIAFASEDPRRIPPVANFLLQQGRNAEVRDWLESLPEETRNMQPILMVLTDAIYRMGDLESLAGYLRIEWEQDDYYRLASLTRVLRSLDRSREAGESWQRATISATPNPEHLRALYELAVKWEWTEERHDLLDRVFHANPREEWAFEELSSLHYQRRNTSELVRVFSRKLEYQPGDRAASNTFAYLCLLQEIHRARAHRLAQQNFDSDPANPNFVTTQAFSLYRQGRNEDALKTLEALGTETFSEQAGKLHYALILTENNRIQEAQQLLATVESDRLLPEERALEQRARQQIADLQGT